ncbi:hypothetical protein [Roseicella sp. DB1501]|uniref:hypothetical protein n=1 Tax=Roseicella sp. DB1501 TaxID=2730925 RepID=UPI0014918AA5|nr:hypothetical protein [Roseicella sp. DB1501]NOG69229.1 hypothetical protein [Roseicella sp. DB1501]
MMGRLFGALALATSLAACGTNSTDRTTGGAAAGAATGAGIGALGGPVGALAGAAIGGGAGAVAGATTSPSDVNLGKPVWKNPEVRTPLDEKSKSSARTQRKSSQTAARNEPRNERDRAFMGGGMVGTPASSNSTATTGSAATTPSGSSAPAPAR